jgi:hypothetical protein
LEWDRVGRLSLNPSFQRGDLWSLDAKSYLVDSVLRGFPIPKVFLRTRIDAATQVASREVVDGQQRLRAILEFASGELRLNRRAGDYAGLEYRQLDDELKQSFLSYSVSVEQLLGASDEDVLEVFARLNTFTVPLNSQEQRHAKYSGEFKFAVRLASQALRGFWEQHRLFSVQQRVRMQDDQFTAEMFGILLKGVVNAGRPYLDGLYKAYDEEFADSDSCAERTESVLGALEMNVPDLLERPFYRRPPQLLMLFAAAAHVLFGIPAGTIELPERPARTDLDWPAASRRLAELADAAGRSQPPQEYVEFATAAKGATTRIASRAVRFGYVWRALVGQTQDAPR